MHLRFLTLFLALFICACVSAQSWVELNPPANPFNRAIRSMVADAYGNVYAAGEFQNANNENFVAKWNGTAWSELGTGSNGLHANNTILSLALDQSGNVYAAGGFTNSSGKYYVAKWNGNTWSEVGTGFGQLNPNGVSYAMAIGKT